MSLSNYAYKSAVIYVLIYFSPLITQPFHFTKGQTIYFTAIAYLIGAILLLVLNQQQPAKNKIEVKQAGTTLVAIIGWGIIGIVIAFISQIAASLLEQLLFNAVPASDNTLAIVKIIKQYPIYLVAVSIAGPIMEELVFRRAFIGWLSQYSSPLIGAILSSLLFAVAHFDGHLLIYFAMGMTFYLLYQKTGSIWTSIIAHCSMNFLVMFLQVVVQPYLTK